MHSSSPLSADPRTPHLINTQLHFTSLLRIIHANASSSMQIDEGNIERCPNLSYSSNVSNSGILFLIKLVKNSADISNVCTALSNLSNSTPNPRTTSRHFTSQNNSSCKAPGPTPLAATRVIMRRMASNVVQISISPHSFKV